MNNDFNAGPHTSCEMLPKETWKNVCSLQIRQQEQNKEMTPPKEANDKWVRFRSKATSMAVEACKGPPQP